MRPALPGRRAGWLAVVALAIPVVVYAWLALRYATNVPFWDDFELLSTRPDGAVSELEWLARPHNEHRILFTRLVAAALVTVEGHLDFRHLALVGSLLLAPLAAVFVRLSPAGRRSPLLLLPVFVLLFSPFSWENLVWAMAAVQNYGVALFAALAIALYGRGTAACVAAGIGCAAAAVFTSASGLLVFPAMAVAWWFGASDGADRRGRWAQLVALVVAALILAALFLHGHPRTPHDSLAASGASLPVAAATRALVALGSVVNVERLVGSPTAANWVAMAAGLIGLAAFAVLVRRGLARRRPVLFAIVLYFLVYLAVIGAGRTELGVHQAMSSRYVIVSACAFSALFLGWLEMRPEEVREDARAPLALCVGLAFLHLGVALVEARPALEGRRAELLGGMTRWRSTGEGLLHGEDMNVDGLLREAIDSGLYRPPID